MAEKQQNQESGADGEQDEAGEAESLLDEGAALECEETVFEANGPELDGLGVDGDGGELVGLLVELAVEAFVGCGDAANVTTEALGKLICAGSLVICELLIEDAGDGGAEMRYKELNYTLRDGWPHAWIVASLRTRGSFGTF